nr:MAG TPA: hypothetical protein [Bacteriophage sp.]
MRCGFAPHIIYNRRVPTPRFTLRASLWEHLPNLSASIGIMGSIAFTTNQGDVSRYLACIYRYAVSPSEVLYI